MFDTYSMFGEETVNQLCFVTCAECDFDGEMDLALVAYGTVIVGDWVCPVCDGYHEYRHDTAWDMADEAYAREKENW